MLAYRPTREHGPRLPRAGRSGSTAHRRAVGLRPTSVSGLARPLPMSRPAVVQHLQVLETSGVVHLEKIGRVPTCQTEPAALRPMEQWISARRSTRERRLDRLGEYLAEDACLSRRWVEHATFVVERNAIPSADRRSACRTPIAAAISRLGP